MLAMYAIKTVGAACVICHTGSEWCAGGGGGDRLGGEERVEALVVFAVLVPDAGVGGRGGGFGAALG